MKQKVVVIVRTRDEEKRIGKFCESYKDADVIIVSDGGSEDRTVEIAGQYLNVVLRPFSGRTQLGNGYWRNNDADHANFLIEQSKEFSPDWVIYDDCDCRPNYLLKKDYRELLENTIENVVMAVRVYHWGTDEWFPLFSSPAGQYEASLWAWRGSLNFSFIDNPPAYWFAVDGQQVEKNDLHLGFTVRDLYPPHCLLHYSWNEETVTYKIKNYRDSGFIPSYGDPRVFAGERKPIEEWMRE
jgi:glycosyltransferase involved in cell wall biosynthesis